LFRKVLYLMGFLVFSALLFFVYQKASRPVSLAGPGGAPGTVESGVALIRLEDVSPGTYDTADKLGKLRAMADYLHKEGVPFHVSVIPVYKDPANNVEISIGDTGDPRVREFIATIKYLRGKGGMIGLHGYTHQYLAQETGSGFEFMARGSLPYAQPAYAEGRVKKALELMDRAGIPVDYWETPHYTASPEQYKVFSNYFGILYEPNPWDRALGNISFRDSTGPDDRSVIFVPAPFLNVNGEQDVDRILSRLDKKGPGMLASFFFHPFQEFRFMYKMKAPEGYEFYVHETESYLHRLVNGFKERGYRFVTVYDMIGFLPAQRVENLSPTAGKVLLTGDFDGDGRWDLLAGDPAAGRWLVTRSLINRALPRNNPGVFSPAGEWLDNWGRGGGMNDFATGDFNGDGRSDLAYWDEKTGEIRVAPSDGNKFVPRLDAGGGFNPPGGVVEMLSGDFNGDGRDDLLFRLPGENKVYVMLGGESGFSPASLWLERWPGGGDLTAVAGDFNRDGKTDLALYDRVTGTVDVALSDGSRFAPFAEDRGRPWIKDFATGGGWRLLVGDFNGDGKDDLAAYDSAAGKWAFARSDGGEFSAEDRFSLTWGRAPGSRALAADFNGDGKSDLAVERRFAGGREPIDFAISAQNYKEK